jgi:hypothetical protein
VEDYEDEEQELLEPPNYVMESGYRPNPVLVPNEYEDGEKGQCVICGAKGPVETECNNFPEG